MSLGPVSSEWFRNMALFSITNSLKNNNTSGEMFEDILQTVIDEQSNLRKPEFSSVNLSINGSLFPLKEFTSLQTSLDFTEKSSQTLDLALKGKLANMGEQFIAAGRAYNINPDLLASIAIHETGNGKSKAAIEKLNVAGMMSKNGLKQYHSIEESIFDMARNLRENYFNKGFDTIPKIGAKYAPIGAVNDPTGLNNHWVKGVNSYFHSLS